jgi:hypothetical protein
METLLEAFLSLWLKPSGFGKELSPIPSAGALQKLGGGSLCLSLSHLANETACGMSGLGGLFISHIKRCLAMQNNLG